MATRSVSVQLEHLTNDLGLWCNDCMLASGVRIWFTATCQGTTLLRTTYGCVDCDGDNVSDT